MCLRCVSRVTGQKSIHFLGADPGSVCRQVGFQQSAGASEWIWKESLLVCGLTNFCPPPPIKSTTSSKCCCGSFTKESNFMVVEVNNARLRVSQPAAVLQWKLWAGKAKPKVGVFCTIVNRCYKL